MEKKLTELVRKVYAERDLDKKLALIEELKEALDQESERLKRHSPKPD